MSIFHKDKQEETHSFDDIIKGFQYATNKVARSDFVNDCINNFTGIDLNMELFRHYNARSFLDIEALHNKFGNSIMQAQLVANIPRGSMLFIRRPNSPIYSHVIFYLGGTEQWVAGCNHGCHVQKNGIYHFVDLFRITGNGYAYIVDPQNIFGVDYLSLNALI